MAYLFPEAAAIYHRLSGFKLQKFSLWAPGPAGPAPSEARRGDSVLASSRCCWLRACSAGLGLWARGSGSTSFSTWDSLCVDAPPFLKDPFTGFSSHSNLVGFVLTNCIYKHPISKEGQILLFQADMISGENSVQPSRDDLEEYL